MRHELLDIVLVSVGPPIWASDCLCVLLQQVQTTDCAQACNLDRIFPTRLFKHTSLSHDCCYANMRPELSQSKTTLKTSDFHINPSNFSLVSKVPGYRCTPRIYSFSLLPKFELEKASLTSQIILHTSEIPTALNFRNHQNLEPTRNQSKCDRIHAYKAFFVWQHPLK